MKKIRASRGANSTLLLAVMNWKQIPAFSPVSMSVWSYLSLPPWQVLSLPPSLAGPIPPPSLEGPVPPPSLQVLSPLPPCRSCPPSLPAGPVPPPSLQVLSPLPPWQVHSVYGTPPAHHLLKVNW